MAEHDQVELALTALERAKKAAEQKTNQRGNTALSVLLDNKITPQAISQWDQVPLTRVFDVERVTGIPRHELRPDFFGVFSNQEQTP